MSLRPLAALMIPFLAFSCGGTAEDGGSHGTGGSHASGGGASTGSTGGGSSTGGGNSTGGSANSCDSFDDDAPGQLEVLITNQRSTSIFLGSRSDSCGGGEAPFTLADEEGQPIQWFAGWCSDTCATLRDVGIASCPAACSYPTIFEVEPGKSHSVSWDALVRLPRTLPVDCVTHDYGPTEPAECRQAKRIVPGTFTFRANAGTELDCSQSFDQDGCGTCMAAEDGGCSYYGANVGGDFLNAKVTVDLDASYGVGWDDSDAGQDPMGAIRNVEIIFGVSCPPRSSAQAWANGSGCGSPVVMSFWRLPLKNAPQPRVQES